MSDLTYVPTKPPATPFKVGDPVDILDREGDRIDGQIIETVAKTHVVTDCGRSWTKNGDWYDGRAYPFPSIRHAVSL